MKYFDGLGWGVVITMLLMAIPFVLVALRHGRLVTEIYKEWSYGWNPYTWNHFKIGKFRKSVNPELNKAWDSILTRKEYRAFNLHPTNACMTAFAKEAEVYKRKNWWKHHQPINIANLANALGHIVLFGFIIFPLTVLLFGSLAKFVKLNVSGSLSGNLLAIILWGAYLVWKTIRLWRTHQLHKDDGKEPLNEAHGEIIDSWERRGMIMDEITYKYFDDDPAKVIAYAKSPEGIENQMIQYIKVNKKNGSEWIDYSIFDDTWTQVSDKGYDRDMMAWWMIGIILATIAAMLLVGLAGLINIVSRFFGAFSG